ncbi:protein translocase subunit SecD [Spirochaeta cellobiosiphila]|uniref:protein translocase subunit SecD n=1 Tax=Spirochaeta cellobiosiphila TaxID=504483 RepID=UPI000424D49F|nr:protein translocase subunit SecD [Spirochaeta cellobiosiphila]
MNKRNRFLITLLVIAFAVWFLYPTVKWYAFTGEDEQTLAGSSIDQIRTYAQGMSQKTLSDLLKKNKNAPDTLLSSDLDFLIKAAKDNYKLADQEYPKTWTVEAVFKGFQNKDEIITVLERHYRDYALNLKSQKNKILKLGLDLSGGMSVVLKADMDKLAKTLGKKTLTNEQREDAMNGALEILNNRIDKFGLTEPQIRREAGGERIFIDIPGEPDPSIVESFINDSGSLRFQIVDSEATATLQQYIATHPGDSFDTEGQLDLPEGLLPINTTVLNMYDKDDYGMDVFSGRIVLHSEDKYKLDGSHITNVQIGSNAITSQPTVNFQLDPEGAELFYTLTSENTGKSMAIVMDDKVKSRANITEAIAGGSVQVSGFNASEASDLEIILKTASLPVSLVIENYETVGASLGADAIHSGVKAIALGFVLVIVFMFIYYKGAGLVADIALLLNLVFMVAILSTFGSTLTLTGIAGIILTVGMAVDANVIIFERIKEEYLLGKSASASVEAGFKKAFWTIMDSNITTFIAAVFLSYLGSGPIQGFALTLAVGIISSMFTALFVSRLIFDFGLETLNMNKLSITWRKVK